MRTPIFFHWFVIFWSLIVLSNLLSLAFAMPRPMPLPTSDMPPIFTATESNTSRLSTFVSNTTVVTLSTQFLETENSSVSTSSQTSPKLSTPSNVSNSSFFNVSITTMTYMQASINHTSFMNDNFTTTENIFSTLAESTSGSNTSVFNNLSTIMQFGTTTQGELFPTIENSNTTLPLDATENTTATSPVSDNATTTSSVSDTSVTSTLQLNSSVSTENPSQTTMLITSHTLTTTPDSTSKQRSPRPPQSSTSASTRMASTSTTSTPNPTTSQTTRPTTMKEITSVPTTMLRTSRERRPRTRATTTTIETTASLTTNPTTPSSRRPRPTTLSRVVTMTMEQTTIDNKNGSAIQVIIDGQTTWTLIYALIGALSVAAFIVLALLIYFWYRKKQKINFAKRNQNMRTLTDALNFTYNPNIGVTMNFDDVYMDVIDVPDQHYVTQRQVNTDVDHTYSDLGERKNSKRKVSFKNPFLSNIGESTEYLIPLDETGFDESVYERIPENSSFKCEKASVVSTSDSNNAPVSTSDSNNAPVSTSDSNNAPPDNEFQ